MLNNKLRKQIKVLTQEFQQLVTTSNTLQIEESTKGSIFDALKPDIKPQSDEVIAEVQLGEATFKVTINKKQNQKGTIIKDFIVGVVTSSDLINDKYVMGKIKKHDHHVLVPCDADVGNFVRVKSAIVVKSVFGGINPNRKKWYTVTLRPCFPTIDGWKTWTETVYEYEQDGQVPKPGDFLWHETIVIEKDMRSKFYKTTVRPRAGWKISNPTFITSRAYAVNEEFKVDGVEVVTEGPKDPTFI